MAAPPQRVSPLWVVALTLCLALTALWLESARRASQSLALAERAEQRGEMTIALDRYQQAARSYAPLTQAPWLAIQHLERLAERGAGQGDQALSIGALSRLRGAAWATRGLLNPYGAQLGAWNHKLAALLAQKDYVEATRTGEATPTLDELKALHLTLLTRDPLPPLYWSLCLALGLLLSVTGALGLIWRGLDAQLNAQASLPRWLVTLTLGCALWITALACMPS